uniref:Uncharacterized protein n=1 Tax=Bionectria ochroleuca TaxID=29856 RepID=A0A8H7TT28_BIOOC
MTSIQLPPLTFDEGGFRVSVIANGPSRDSTNGIPSSHTQSQRNTIPEVPEPDDDDSAAMQQLNQAPDDPPIPEHPIPSMQDAFAESLLESTQGALTRQSQSCAGMMHFIHLMHRSVMNFLWGRKIRVSRTQSGGDGEKDKNNTKSLN